MTTPTARLLAALLTLAALTGGIGLSGCNQPIDPDRPPLKDYEPPPIRDWPDQQRDPYHRV